MTSQGEQTGRPKIIQGKALWLSIVFALAVPTVIAVGSLFVSDYRIDANAQDIQKNGTAISTIPQIFIPRMEIDAKLETIDVKIDAVQRSLDRIESRIERPYAPRGPR